MAKGKKPKQPKIVRPLWQRICRWAVVVALALTTAYVTLPWWAPRGLMARVICRQLADQIGQPVHLGSVTLSWGRGLEIHDLAIDSRGEPNAPLVSVHRVRADFAPLALLVQNRLDWMELDRPHLNMSFDADGNCNLDALRRLQSDVVTRRISIRQATIDIRLPSREQPIRLDVSDMQLLAGRQAPIGKMTLSGSLCQAGGNSPISLYFAEGDGASDLAGAASLKFQDVDLQQLHLEQLLDRLRTFSGHCSGSLDLQANRQGKIDHFALDVSVRRLDVQPRQGSPLPVLEHATIRAAAAYDFVTSQLDIRSMRFLVPGLAMEGKASLLLDAPGGWESIRSLHLAGQVFPSELAALAGGATGDVAMRGPLDLDVSVDEKPDAHGETLRLALIAKATGAQIDLGPRVIKPKGRPLEAKLAGELKLDDWTFTAEDEQTILLGPNVLKGAGQIRNIKSIIEHFDPNDPLKLLTALAGVKWEGTWELKDLAAVTDLLPAGPQWLPLLHLDGPINGRCTVDQAEGASVRLGLTVPANTALAVGDAIGKPKGKELKLTLSTTVDGPGAMHDMDMHLSMGGGRLHAYNGSLKFEGKGGPLIGSGGFQVEHIQSLMELLAERPAGLDLRGNLDGKYSLKAMNDSSLLNIDADVEPLAVALGEIVSKPGGMAGSVKIAAVSLAGVNPMARVKATYQWTGGEVTGMVTHRGEANQIMVGGSIDFKDANVVCSLSPLVARAMHGCRVSGPLAASVMGTWENGVLEGSLAVDANLVDLTIATGGVERHKPAGLPASMIIDAKVAIAQDLSLNAELTSAVFEGPSCGLTLAGHVDVAPPISVGQEFFDRPLRQFECTVRTHCRVDAALRQWLPELDRGIGQLKFDGEFWTVAGGGGRLEIAGPLTTTTAVALHDNLYTVHFQLDANDVSLAGPLNKPSQMPAGAQAELTVRPGPWRVQLNSLTAQFGDKSRAIAVVADGNARFDAAGGMLADMTGQAAVSINDASLLGQLVVPLADYLPAGQAFLRARWNEADGPTISQVEFQTPGISARWRGRRVSVSGQACVQGISALGSDHPAIGEIRSDGLSIEAGQMELHVLADVRQPLSAPAGKIEVLAGTLDLKDIADWLAPQPTPQTAPQSRPALTAAEANTVVDKAHAAIAGLRQATEHSQLQFILSSDNFRVHDDPTDQYFDVRYAQIAATMDQGKVMLSLSGGVNGGEILKTLEVDLGADAPAAVATTTLRDVLARPNVQPQIARFFPGNTVYGSLSQDEKATIPLADLAANMIDPRHVVHPVGSGQTVAVDGVLEGRAAPQFIASIFPGLNLTQYRYNKMTGFADYKVDGSASNDMIFTGSLYDLYMEGTTDPLHIARYETGVILLSPPQSPQWNHGYRVGRIPILKIKARIEDGKLLDQEVSYPWPNQTLGAILIRDNFFYRLWVNAREKK